MNRPNIFLFEDPNLFLKSYFDYLRGIEPELTLRRWAVRMGVNSPVLIAAAVRGQRKLKIKELGAILKGLDLNNTETRYLQMLVLLKRAASSEEAQFFMSELSLLKRALAQTPERPSRDETTYASEDPDLFSHWMDAAVISALQLKAARGDLETIRKHFLWENDPDQVNRSVSKLCKLGLLEEDQAHRLNPKYDSTTTQSDRYHRGGRSFVAQMNKIATDAIELPYEKREFQCFSIPVKSTSIALFKQKLREFRDSVSVEADEDGDVVYQFNFEMFPLTEHIVAYEEKHESRNLLNRGHEV